MVISKDCRIDTTSFIASTFIDSSTRRFSIVDKQESQQKLCDFTKRNQVCNKCSLYLLIFMYVTTTFESFFLDVCACSISWLCVTKKQAYT